MSDDLPAKRLARLYGVNHFIVSQTNPIVLWAVRDTKIENSGLLNSLRQLGGRSIKEFSKVGSSMARKYFKNSPRVRRVSNIVYSVINQEYTGDINIIPRYRFFDPRKLLTELTPEELQFFIAEGERATWPKIEMIRASTTISRKLTEVLANYEAEELGALSKSHHHLGADMPRSSLRA